jgi:hypothetical protein
MNTVRTKSVKSNPTPESAPRGKAVPARAIGLQFLRSAAKRGQSEENVARGIAEDTYKAAGCESKDGPSVLMRRLGYGAQEADVTRVECRGRVIFYPSASRTFDDLTRLEYRGIAELLLRDRGYRPEPGILQALTEELIFPTSVLNTAYFSTPRTMMTADALEDLQPYANGEYLHSIARYRWRRFKLGPSRSAEVADLASYRRGVNRGKHVALKEPTKTAEHWEADDAS